jgi:hypothetical protein
LVAAGILRRETRTGSELSNGRSPVTPLADGGGTGDSGVQEPELLNAASHMLPVSRGEFCILLVACALSPFSR